MRQRVYTLRLRRRARNEYSPWDSGEGWGTGIHPNTPGEGRGTGIQPEIQERGGKRVFTLWLSRGVGNGYLCAVTQETGGERVFTPRFRKGVENGYPR